MTMGVFVEQDMFVNSHGVDCYIMQKLGTILKTRLVKAARQVKTNIREHKLLHCVLIHSKLREFTEIFFSDIWVTH